MARLKDTGRKYLAVTPHDTNPLAKGTADGFYIGGAGTVVLVGEDGDSAQFICTDFQTLPFSALRVLATGTTATNIVAVYG